MSKAIHESIPAYMKWKYKADVELHKRTAFKWFIIRPGYLLDEPGTGKADIGITHILKKISVRNGDILL